MIGSYIIQICLASGSWIQTSNDVELVTLECIHIIIIKTIYFNIL